MGFIIQTADLVYRSSSLEGSDLNIDVDDLVQEGSIGLLRAVDGFDPARKLKFLTYAAPAIKNAMLDLVHTAQMSFEHRMATAKVKDGVEGLGLERVYLDEILPGDERLLRIEAIADPYALLHQSGNPVRALCGAGQAEAAGADVSTVSLRLHR